MKRTTCGILSVFILSLSCHACAKMRMKADTDSGSSECEGENGSESDCSISEEIIDREVKKANIIDLLFVVDNSKSMAQEQAKLRAQIPRMIGVLTTGDRTPENGFENNDFQPVKDLHLAVVSSDMGLPGLAPGDNPDTTGACNGTGDDGRFRRNISEAIAEGMSCPGIGDYPLFLEHIREDKEDRATTLQRAETTAEDFGCLAALGTSGCGFEMPLESALKALWPAQINNLSEDQRSLEINFLSGSQGRGDNEHKDFLRGTPYHPTEADKISFLAIVLVTDEEDCSAGAQDDLQFLSINFPGGTRNDLNLRCYKDTLNAWDNKYPVSRYIDGFKALRPRFPDRVVFAAIAGIPSGLREDANRDNNISDQEREDFYNQILNHPFMQETPNPVTNNLEFSCEHQDFSTGEYDTQAAPARRIAEVARGFGANGVLRSICSDDFTPAMDAILDVIVNNVNNG